MKNQILNINPNKNEWTFICDGKQSQQRFKSDIDAGNGLIAELQRLKEEKLKEIAIIERAIKTSYLN